MTAVLTTVRTQITDDPKAEAPPDGTPSGGPRPGPDGTPSGGPPPAAKPASTVVDSADDKDPDSAVSFVPLFVTAGAGLAAAAVGHLGVWWAYHGRFGDDTPFWQPWVGFALAALAISTFAGVYAASRRLRAAIAATIVLMFLLILTFAITIPEFATRTGQPGVIQLMGDFHTVLIAVIGFYFGSEAVVGATKVWQSAKQGATPAQIRRADRDMVGGTR